MIVNVICEQDTFTANVHQKPTLSGVYTHFDSLLPNTYKICMIYTLVKNVFRYALTGQCSIHN